MSRPEVQAAIDKSHPCELETKESLKADELAMELIHGRHEKREIVNMLRWVIMGCPDVRDGASQKAQPWDIRRFRPNTGSEEWKKNQALQGHLTAGKKDSKTSRYRGVHWGAKQQKWVVQIREPGKRIGTWVGNFKDEDDAAEAYNIAARAIHGEQAFQNQIPSRVGRDFQ